LFAIVIIVILLDGSIFQLYVFDLYLLNLKLEVLIRLDLGLGGIVDDGFGCLTVLIGEVAVFLGVVCSSV
jgi:hypothetical protein